MPIDPRVLDAVVRTVLTSITVAGGTGGLLAARSSAAAQRRSAAALRGLIARTRDIAQLAEVAMDHVEVLDEDL